MNLFKKTFFMLFFSLTGVAATARIIFSTTQAYPISVSYLLKKINKIGKKK